jgi:hypothetical protein
LPTQLGDAKIGESLAAIAGWLAEEKLAAEFGEGFRILDER